MPGMYPNYGMPNMYGQIPSYAAGIPTYNPMAYTQQRLATLEQQYPQFSQQPVGPQIKCRAVTSLDEVKAAQIDLDGTLNVFVDAGNKKIYTKQVGLDGTAPPITYIVDNKPQEEAKKEDQVVSVEEFNKTVDELKKEIFDLKARMGNKQQGAPIKKEETRDV